MRENNVFTHLLIDVIYNWIFNIIYPAIRLTEALGWAYLISVCIQENQGTKFNNRVTVLKANAYYPNVIEIDYFESESTPKSEELIKISNSIVNTDENKLAIINLVNLRKTLVAGSTILMLEIKGQTQQFW